MSNLFVTLTSFKGTLQGVYTMGDESEQRRDEFLSFFSPWGRWRFKPACRAFVPDLSYLVLHARYRCITITSSPLERFL